MGLESTSSAHNRSAMYPKDIRIAGDVSFGVTCKEVGENLWDKELIVFWWIAKPRGEFILCLQCQKALGPY